MKKPTESEMVDWVLEQFKNAPPKHQEEFKNREIRDLIMYHSTLGQAIRNHFKLWETKWKPEIDVGGVDYSPDHPDAISHRVIEAAWRKLQ
jgi:hypothetical protein